MKSMRYAAAIALISIFLCVTAGHAKTGGAEGGASVVEIQASVAQQQSNVDIGKIVQETMKFAFDVRHQTMVFWLPSEFWKAVILSSDSVNPSMMAEMLFTLKPYTILAVSDSRTGVFGGSTYLSEDEIKKLITVSDGNGNVYQPMEDKFISEDIKTLLLRMKPVLMKSSGDTGKNIHFLVFKNEDSSGERVVDPTKPGTFTVGLGDRVFRWRLPMGTLMAPVSCPKCEEECSGAWGYCPWDGTKLPASEPL